MRLKGLPRKFGFCFLLCLFWLSLVFPYMMLSYRMSGGSQMAYLVHRHQTASSPDEHCSFFTPGALRAWDSAVFSEYLYGKVTLFCGNEALQEFTQTRAEIAQTPQAEHYLELAHPRWALLWYLGEGEKAVTLETLPKVEELAATFDPFGGPRTAWIDFRQFLELWSKITLVAPQDAIAFREYGFLLDVLPAVTVGLLGVPFIAPAGIALAFLPRLFCPVFLLFYAVSVTYYLGRKIFAA
ncbi:MAG: hypothetical protein ACOX8W_08250 [bacterium]